MTALAMISVSTGSTQAAKLFQMDDYYEHDSEGILLNADGTAGTDTARIRVDSSGNFIIDADGEFRTANDVNFSGASQVRIREVAFGAYSGALAPQCNTVNEIALDTNTKAVFVCTVVGAPNGGTWKSADNNPAPGTTDNAILKWDTATSAWVEETNFLVDDSGNGDFLGTITAGSGNTQITNATGDLQQTYDFTNDNVLTDNDSVYSALDKLDTEFGLIDFEYVYGNDADKTLTTSNGNFTIALGSGVFNLNGTTNINNNVNANTQINTGTSTGTVTVGNASAGAITIDSGAGISLDGVGASNFTTDSGNLTLSTTTTGNVNITSVGDIVFTDQYDSLTFGQTSVGLGDDLLNGLGEVYEATGAIGSTIGVGGETSTSLIHAINAVGTYAVTIGAGALDNIDDVYNHSVADGVMYANVDTSSTGYNITSTDGDAFEIQNSGTPFASFLVNASDQSIIDFDSYAFTVDTTNAISLDASAASNFTVDGANLTLSTTTSGNVALSSAGEIFFGDTRLLAAVQLTESATAWHTDFATNGIVDNINDIATLLGGDTISTYNFTENNVLADDDAVYAALNKLDLKWGDLASTANGEGASLVGIEDTGGYFTSTDVEGALQELGLLAGAKVETLRFYPDYPDAVYDAGIDRGRLDAIYDATEGNAYEWTTQQNADQTMIIRKRFEMPADFADVNDLTLRYKTSTANTADNSVALSMYNVTDDASCGSVAAAASAAWATMTLAEATIEGACTLDAGDIVEIRVTLLADKNGGAYAGHVLLGYDK